MLTEILRRTTGKTVAQISFEQVFTSMGFTRTGWRTQAEEELVQTVFEPTEELSWEIRDSPDGDDKNMFTTTREL